MLAKRIVPCLDIKDGKTVKGINFVNFRDAGDPVELGTQYSREGADELVYLDITASHEGRKTFTELVKKVAANISIPFTVGGGINELKDVDRLLSAGADKVSINSAALRNPSLIEEIAKNFGSQVCVVAIDANYENGDWICYLNGGRIPTEKHLFQWAAEAENLGAGEILFTSMTHDGVKDGYANEALSTLADNLHIPVIASGGAGKMEHFRDTFAAGKADAALAASVFHFGEIGIADLKQYLNREGINVRKMGGLIPAIVQDNNTNKVLMLGFMNEEAYEETKETGKVTFFSRTKNRLWMKGETSGNTLQVVSMMVDCDNDTILIKANPAGPVCHTGADTCFGEKNVEDIMFLKYLQDFIEQRRQEMPEGSYTTSLFLKGVNRMAQKVGEEAVETVIEATNGTEDGFIYEASDLIYHLIVLLTSKGLRLEDLARELKKRHKG